MLIQALVPSLALLIPFAGRQALVQGSSGPEPARPADTRTAVVLAGVVLEPSGAPAGGAVVTSSAGGQAVAARDGRYALEVEVPIEAEYVQLTAVGVEGGGWTARTNARVSSASGFAQVDPLVLALGTECEPRWQPTFPPLPGVNGQITSMAVFDDGGGPALYVGGAFSLAGGVPANNVAKWDGRSWSALGTGIDSDLSGVNALAVYGGALYAGGYFTSAGGVVVSAIARWDGTSWSDVGGGVDTNSDTPWVNALAVFDAGSGPALYAGGRFISAGGVTATRIARWNGSSWSGLGSPVSDQVQALAVVDLGGGPALYAGGEFTTAGGVTVNHVARWNGSGWSALGGGVGGGIWSGTDVKALAAFDDGGGPALYVGGDFTTASGVPVSRIARWDGASWSDVGGGVVATVHGVHALAVFDDGAGAALYAGGEFTSAGGVPAKRIARWDGSAWTDPGGGMPGILSVVGALLVFDDGRGPALHAGGSFVSAGGVAANNLARWDGSSWKGTSHGMNGEVEALTVFDDGSGPALHAGGEFTVIGEVPAMHIAAWSDSSWTALGSGVGSMETDTVRAMAVFDDGGGAALFAGGFFHSVSGTITKGIAKWNGTSWTPLGGGINASVAALAVHDDGGGPALFVGGNFTLAGGATANRIAKWDGASWSPLGSGMNEEVWALAVFDDGGGPALYAGGAFRSAGGVSADYIAKWDGAAWSPLAGGMNGSVNALAVFDDGSGQALYAGGYGAPHYLARWNGTSWSPVGGGMNSWVRAFVTFDDGTGPALFAGGDFTIAGGVAANRIARWDGTSWSPLGSGLQGSVRAFAVFDDGRGPDLYVGGAAPSSAGFGNPVVDSFLARWGCPSPGRTRVRKL